MSDCTFFNAFKIAGIVSGVSSRRLNWMHIWKTQLVLLQGRFYHMIITWSSCDHDKVKDYLYYSSFCLLFDKYKIIWTSTGNWKNKQFPKIATITKRLLIVTSYTINSNINIIFITYSFHKKTNFIISFISRQWEELDKINYQ